MIMIKFKLVFYVLILILSTTSLFAQSTFDYELELIPISVPNLPGFHSFAFAQDNGKWLVIGGRLDGLHARQPFNAFPQGQNNQAIYVIDIQTQQYWSAPLTSLATSIQEQLQSTNMNFYQDKDSLYLIGGYAYSATAGDHVTFPNLTAIDVPGLIDALINGTAIDSYFKQITAPIFAVTGGQLGKIEDNFYLVGGHRFDGRYNPMGNPTYSQTYTDKIQKFKLNNTGAQLSFSNYVAITDPIHLHRRDYNLLPQIFPDGTQGYTISSGVFQTAVDLPFLYPVNITANGYDPITNFNQYLSNYHGAKACLYDSIGNNMHNLFFGGMSQYYYSNGILMQDNLVPFVKTISRLTRMADSSLHEFQLPQEMPSLKGTSAEFIPNNNLPHYPSEIIKISSITQDSFIIGHILGGIQSPSRHPFSTNQSSTTNADNSIYAVRLIKTIPSNVQKIEGEHHFEVTVSPNPAEDYLQLSFELQKASNVRYYLTSPNGRVLVEKDLEIKAVGKHEISINLDKDLSRGTLFLTVIFDHKYYVNKTITVQ
ncbi:MAG: Unknown protein [uncultured Aureispira sp.]|uniref:Secretion system C-terminal sorting domain-containing protein n=1 Tax=uncultured Aureispira sp. TaxID=1331704 RepID=A0A6S6UDT8_9BACT|nr:MAG: Unknown protein [uncultured Aureispira sp.]